MEPEKDVEELDALVQLSFLLQKDGDGGLDALKGQCHEKSFQTETVGV